MNRKLTLAKNICRLSFLRGAATLSGNKKNVNGSKCDSCYKRFVNHLFLLREQEGSGGVEVIMKLYEELHSVSGKNKYVIVHMF